MSQPSQPTEHKYKLLTVYNNKGGVAKTTWTVHLGFAIAEAGNTVMLVDCDPQMNLTQFCLRPQVEANGKEDDPDDLGWDFEEFFQKKQSASREPITIYQGLRPITDQLGQNIRNAWCFPMDDWNRLMREPTEPGQRKGRLYLLAGDSELSEFEIQLCAAYQSNGGFDVQNLSALSELIGKTAAKYKADYVIMDTSPSKGKLNQHIVSMSDFLLLPCQADYYSYEAFRAMVKLLKEWVRELARLKLIVASASMQSQANVDSDEENAQQQEERPLCTHVKLMRKPIGDVPRILGALLSRYHEHRKPREASMSPNQAHEFWINRLDGFLLNEWLRDNKKAKVTYNDGEGHKTRSLFLSPNTYHSVANVEDAFQKPKTLERDTLFLGCLPEYNQLGPISHQHCVPVTALKRDNMSKQDWKEDKTGKRRRIQKPLPPDQQQALMEHVQRFQGVFARLSDVIIKLTNAPPEPG